MRNAATIWRRELAAYFTGPVGYVFLSAFLLFLNLLAFFIVQRFFDFPVADLRPYFHVLAGVGSFLVAAVTMRLWSEDRKENTFELLLTLPLRARYLVLGKFLAAFSFYTISLVLTLAAPLMMVVLSRSEGTGAAGLLDPGAAASGYFGAWLCGGLFVAFGLWVSGLCRDQVVAFVLTAPALFFAYILGLPWVQQAMNQALDAAGADLGLAAGRVVGVFQHYDNLARGLVDVGDVLFFVIWTFLFLFLNALTIERRGRPGANLRMALATVLVFGIGAAGNWLLSDLSLWHFDATADRVFTVSPVSARILGRMEDKLRIRYHVSPRDKLPEAMRTVERDIRDKLDSLRRDSRGKLEYQVVIRNDLEEAADPARDPDNPDAAADSEADKLNQTLFRKIQPFTVAVSGEDRESLQLVYSALELIYGGDDKETEILGQVVPSAFADSRGSEEIGIAQLEYRIVNYVNRVTRARAPSIALVAPVRDANPQMAQLFMSMGRQPPPPEDPFAHLASILQSWENYQVRRARLAPGDVVPDDCDALVVVAPQELSPRQRYEIARAITSGKPTLLAVQRQVYEYNVTASGYQGVRRDLNPNVDDLLPPGVTLTETMLVDRADRAFMVQAPVRTPFGNIMQPFPRWPTHVTLSGDSLAAANPAFDGVTRLRWLWGNALELDAAKLSDAGIKATTLVKANPASGLRDSWRSLTPAFLRDPAAAEIPAARPTLAVRLEGAFPFPFGERPKWPEPEPNPYGAPPPPPPEDDDEASPPEAKPGVLVLLSSAWLWSREGLDLTPPYPELAFFLNLVGGLALSDEEMELRALRDKMETRRFIPPLSPAQKTRWKMAQVAGPVTLLVLAGVGVIGFRKLRRERYERADKGGS